MYLLANVFLALVPFIPPTGAWDEEGYQYYIFPIVGVLVLVLGGIYWTVWTQVWPATGGYRIVAHRIVEDDGTEVIRYRKEYTKAHHG